MTSPRRRGLRPLAFTAFVLLAACGDSDEGLDPELRAPNTGTYAYDAIVFTDRRVQADTFAGTLEITVSSEDSIIGSWSVPGYDAEARGIWNINAYALPADPVPPIQGTITHRVWRPNTGGGLRCELTYQHVMQTDTFTSSADENNCALVAN